VTTTLPCRRIAAAPVVTKTVESSAREIRLVPGDIDHRRPISLHWRGGDLGNDAAQEAVAHGDQALLLAEKDFLVNPGDIWVAEQSLDAGVLHHDDEDMFEPAVVGVDAAATGGSVCRSGMSKCKDSCAEKQDNYRDDKGCTRQRLSPEMTNTLHDVPPSYRATVMMAPTHTHLQ
jgi:hypothetical protein